MPHTHTIFSILCYLPSVPTRICGFNDEAVSKNLSEEDVVRCDIIVLDKNLKYQSDLRVEDVPDKRHIFQYILLQVLQSVERTHKKKKKKKRRRKCPLSIPRSTPTHTLRNIFLHFRAGEREREEVCVCLCVVVSLLPLTKCACCKKSLSRDRFLKNILRTNVGGGVSGLRLRNLILTPVSSPFKRTNFGGRAFHKVTQGKSKQARGTLHILVGVGGCTLTDD